MGKTIRRKYRAHSKSWLVRWRLRGRLAFFLRMLLQLLLHANSPAVKKIFEEGKEKNNQQKCQHDGKYQPLVIAPGAHEIPYALQKNRYGGAEGGACVEQGRPGNVGIERRVGG